MANFDGVARWYRWLEYSAFWSTLEQCRFTLLPELVDAHRVLILGEGDGRFLQKFLTGNEHAQIDVVDASPAMLKLAHSRVSEEQLDRVRFHQTDVRYWSFPKAEYDTIVTCFFLDCFTQDTLVDLLPRIAKSAKPGAQWLLAEFADASTLRTRIWLSALYAFFRVTTNLEASRLAPLSELLSEEKWERKHRQKFSGGLMTAELWQKAFSPT